MSRKKLTLVLIRESGKVLLGLKKRGFGAGKWNGFGGKVEPGETIEGAAKREVLEECNLKVDKIEKIGLLTFEFVGDPQLLEVHVFTSSNFEGTVQESEEMKPVWYQVNDIPYSHMWSDDKHWFPLFLKGSKFKGHFLYEGHEKILDFQLETVPDAALLGPDCNG